MSQPFPPFVNPNPGIPSFEQFQQQLNLINQQHQQQMWNQYYQFISFCQQRNLNPNDPNALYLFYQQISGVNPNPQPPIPFGYPPKGPIYNPQPPHNPVPSYGNTNVNVNANNVYVNDTMVELIPRGDNTIKYVSEDKNAPNLMNINFKASTGLNVIMTIPGNTTLKSLFEKYMDRLHLPQIYLGNEIQFLYSGMKVDPNSNELVCNKFKNGVTITVFDQGSVIGAF